MEILYFGSACDKEWFNKISKLKGMPYNVAQYMFEMALIAGFSKFNNINMKIYYLYQESYYPKGHFLKFKSKEKKINNKYIVSYLSTINLPIIKELYYFFQGLILTLRWILKNRKNKEKIILTPFNYTPLSLGILLVSKIFQVKRANIFTDLSKDIINNNRQKNMSFFKKIILPYYTKLVDFVEHNYDLYILFTKPMNKIVNPKNKPYLVLEGIFNIDNLDLSRRNKEKAIMYAGTLSKEYGLKYLLDAFEQIEDNNLELWLFGNGDMVDYINKLCKRDDRIKYFGFRSRDEVFEYEKRATLLVNLRNPRDEYTKYSFPSKTFEFMVSGTPFLTTKLVGIPIEYYDYLYVCEDYNVTSIKQKIEEILSLPQEELNNLGKRAKKFILENKNSKIQTLKILSALKKII